MKAKLRDNIIFLISLPLLFGAWEVVWRLGYMNHVFVASPSGIIVTLWDMFVTQRTIYPDLGVTMYELGVGLAIGVICGVIIGLLLGWVSWARAAVEPILLAIYATPLVVLLPILATAFGVGLKLKIAAVVVAAILPMIVNVLAGGQKVDPHLIEMGRAFHANSLTTFRAIIFPSTLPYVLAGLRITLVRSFVIVVVAEFYAAAMGLGSLMVQAGNAMNPSVLFATAIVLAVLATVAGQIVSFIEARIATWR